MFGRVFECSQCEHSFHAGITDMLETEVLPGAMFYNTGDELGYWVSKDKKLYCGPCSDKEFPEILGEDVKLEVTGRICF